MRRTILLCIVGVLSLMARADDRTLAGGEYWVDDGHQSRTTVSITADGLMQFTLDGGQLREGLHALHYRAKDSEGSYSPVQTWLFYRTATAISGTQTLDYWVDDGNHHSQELADSTVVFVLDGSQQREGLHALHYRVTSTNEQNSPLQRWLFYRYVADQMVGSTLEYWIDNSEAHESIAVSGAATAFVLDASAVEEGLHTLHYRLNTLSGQAGAVSTWLFYRTAPAYDSGTRTLEYWIDEAGEHLSQTVGEGDVAFVLDASAVEEGLHTLHYRLTEQGGKASPQQSWLFYRIAPQPEGSSISYYRIWWNDHQDQAVEVQVPGGKAELLYEEALAVPEYAKNDGFSRNNTATIHIVFFNNQGNASPTVSAEVGYPDVYPPVTTLAANKSGDGIALSWTSNEDTVRDWNVCYSENGEPYLLWKANTTEQQATFRGQQGATYKFIVTARDKSGNYEAMEESKAVSVTF